MSDERYTSVLLLDNDTSWLENTERVLRKEGFSAMSCSEATQALELARSQPLSAIVCTVSALPDIQIELLQKFHENNPHVKLVASADFANWSEALPLIAAGAEEVVPKHVKAEDLVFVLRKMEERARRAGGVDTTTVHKQKFNFSSLIAKSRAMEEILETVRRLANFNTTVLITGESGTGKELLARAIHQHSPRRGKPFVAINCGAIPENLMESELFGHRRGSFTDATRDKRGLFEEASGGTIFLDEIGELPLHLQVKLLRALQEQQIHRVGDEQPISIDVRVIAATHRNLEADVIAKRFRDDLYYRLNVVSINIPPLRERPEDIPPLVDAFVRKHSKRLGVKAQGVEPEAMKCLMRHHWKGNVRELENCIERALVLTDTGKIDVDSLPEAIRLAGIQERTPAEIVVSEDNLSIKQRSRALEVNLILKALKETGGNRTRAAKVLEISHRALLYKLKEYGLS